ncbi:TOMM precursor leader peptide-binding protein [Paenibacillus pinistramenti]|uniref:TOMM precursor leader peptide-binding protein n=1 Tax=Paenibacillus pinistramenti TaxID=1768003 RepID=UPI001108190C|nr:TOMM precursor leader peptide-binding protein [Paenibacillus pinistramenti]
MNKDNPAAAVVIVGQGRLAEAVRARLEKTCSIVQQEEVSGGLPLTAKLALVLQDEWEPELLLQEGKRLQDRGIPWLAGYMMEREGAAGLLAVPGVPGCPKCAEYRLISAGSEREEILSSQASLLFYGKIVREQELRSGGIRQLAYLISEEAGSFLQGRGTRLSRQLCLVHMETAECSWHAVLPHPACEICGSIPEDSVAAAKLEFPPSPKAAPDAYRCIPEEVLGKGLLECYFDERTGLLNQKANLLLQSYAEVVMSLPAPYGNEAVGGRSHSYKSSAVTAVLEGLERLCGMSPRAKKTSVFKSYLELGPAAMDPVSAGVYSQEQYADPDCPYEPFDPALPIPWVWGYSFRKQTPVLVPEQLAYYSGGAGFVNEFSNGCALGGSLAEAVFHGILEVVERDSFLMTWYGRLPLPYLDVSEVQDRQLRLMLERVRSVAGYDVHIYNSTMEHGIPSVWAIARNKQAGQANLLCSAGAHPDPVRAAKSALFELAGAIPRIEAGYRERLPHIRELFADASKVEEMEDHALLYSLPEAESRLAFLLEQEREAPPGSGWTLSGGAGPAEVYEDMADEMQSLVQKLLDQGLDVIVVDQTSPEIAVKGLYCVKVLIPGLLPMTFGHSLIRLSGLERVFEVPQKLGYKTGRLKPEELNPYPHPFL